MSPPVHIPDLGGLGSPRCDMVLRHPWAGELEVCEQFGKGRSSAGYCVSPAFLSILPAAG